MAEQKSGKKATNYELPPPFVEGLDALRVSAGLNGKQKSVVMTAAALAWAVLDDAERRFYIEKVGTPGTPAAVFKDLWERALRGDLERELRQAVPKKISAWNKPRVKKPA